MLNREQAISIARAQASRWVGRYDYLPANLSDWMPHEWVISAIMTAANTAHAPVVPEKAAAVEDPGSEELEALHRTAHSLGFKLVYEWHSITTEQWYALCWKHYTGPRKIRDGFRLRNLRGRKRDLLALIAELRQLLEQKTS